MSRMFHRVLATSIIGAAALAAPVTALAADTGGGGGGGGAEPMPTAVVVHLPKHVEAGEPVTVSARVTARTDAESDGEQSGKGQDKPSQGDDQDGRHGTGGGHHRHKGTGHGKKKTKHHKARRHALTGKVSFVLDGKPEPAVEVNRGRASEKIEIPVGRHTIVAEYSGDADYLAAKSDPVTFELTPGQDEPGTSTSTGTSTGTSTPTTAQDGSSAQNGDDQNGDDCGPCAEAGQDPDYPTLGQDQQDPTFDQGQDDQSPDPDQGQDDRRQDD